MHQPSLLLDSMPPFEILVKRTHTLLSNVLPKDTRADGITTCIPPQPFSFYESKSSNFSIYLHRLSGAVSFTIEVVTNSGKTLPDALKGAGKTTSTVFTSSIDSKDQNYLSIKKFGFKCTSCNAYLCNVSEMNEEGKGMLRIKVTISTGRSEYVCFIMPGYVFSNIPDTEYVLDRLMELRERCAVKYSSEYSCLKMDSPPVISERTYRSTSCFDRRAMWVNYRIQNATTLPQDALTHLPQARCSDFKEGTSEFCPESDEVVFFVRHDQERSKDSISSSDKSSLCSQTGTGPDCREEEGYDDDVFYRDSSEYLTFDTFEKKPVSLTKEDKLYTTPAQETALDNQPLALRGIKRDASLSAFHDESFETDFGDWIRPYKSQRIFPADIPGSPIQLDGLTEIMSGDSSALTYTSGSRNPLREYTDEGRYRTERQSLRPFPEGTIGNSLAAGCVSPTTKPDPRWIKDENGLTESPVALRALNTAFGPELQSLSLKGFETVRANTVPTPSLCGPVWIPQPSGMLFPSEMSETHLSPSSGGTLEFP